MSDTRTETEKTRIAVELLDCSPDGYCALDRNGRIAYINKTVETLANLSAPAVLGRTVREAFAPDAGRYLESIVRQVFEDRESRVDTRRGALRPDRAVNVDVFWCGIGVAIRFRDVTEEYVRDEQHTKALAELEAIYKYAPIGLIVVDPELRCLKINDVMARLTGVSVEAHIGRTIDEVLPDLAPVARPFLLKALHERKPILNTELSGTLPGSPGLRTWYQHVSPMFRDGEVYAVLVAVMDLTDLKRAEAELKSALDTQKLLHHEIVHRVANNFQLISSVLRLQASRAGKDDAGIIMAAARRIQAMGLIHRELYLNQSEIGATELGTYLKALCQHIAAAFISAENSRYLTFEATDELNIPSERAIKIGIVVTELVTNAFKYAYGSDEIGAVNVSIKLPDPGHVAVSVRDEGKGLPHDFDIENSSGLGMMIASSQARQLGTTLRVVPRNKGVEFQLIVELEPEGHQATLAFPGS